MSAHRYVSLLTGHLRIEWGWFVVRAMVAIALLTIAFDAFLDSQGSLQSMKPNDFLGKFAPSLTPGGLSLPALVFIPRSMKRIVNLQYFREQALSFDSLNAVDQERFHKAISDLF